MTELRDIAPVAGRLHRVRRIAGGLTGAVPNWLAEAGAREAERWPLFLPVAMGAGIAVYFGQLSEPDAGFALATAGALSLGAMAARWLAPSALAALSLIAAFAIGFAAAAQHTAMRSLPLIERDLRAVMIEGRIVAIEGLGPEDARLIIAPDTIQRVDEAALPGRVRIVVRAMPPGLAAGDRVRLRATLRPLPDPAYPGGFDFGRHLFFQGIGGVGFALGEPERLAASGQGGALEALAHLRAAITARLRAAMGPQEGAIAAALVTGERGYITEEDRDAFRDSGLAHMLAISGLHMALVGLGLFAVLRLAFALEGRLVLRLPAKKFAAGGALIGAAFYLAISGGAVATQRAFLMLAVVFLAIMVDRSALTMRTVAIAAAVVLLIAPDALVSPSFQMSFAAVTALVAGYETLRGRIAAPGRDAGPVTRVWAHGRDIVISTILAGGATALYAAYHFQHVTAYEVIANLLAMPLLAFVVMPAAIAGVMLMPVGLEAAPLWVMEQGIGLIVAAGHFTAGLPGAVRMVAAFPPEALGAATLGGLVICLFRTPLRWAGLAGLVLAAMLAAGHETPSALIGRETAALRQADGRLAVISPRRGRFDAEQWLQADGDDRAPQDAAIAGDGLRCDALGCIAVLPGGTRIALPDDRGALAEDCRRADLVVSHADWLPRACTAVTIDRRALRGEGTHALFERADGIEIRTVRQDRGERPWVTGKNARQ